MSEDVNEQIEETALATSEEKQPNLVLRGINVNDTKGNIYWSEVKETGIDFAFAQATGGLRNLDAKFSTYWVGMKSADIVRGAFHQLVGSQDGQGQAEYFLNVLQQFTTEDLPPAVYIAPDANVTQKQWGQTLNDWLQAVKSELGRSPIIFTSAEIWSQTVNSSDFGEYPLWVVDYTGSRNVQPTLPQGWDNWHFWQYSSTGQVQGVTRRDIDQNMFNGSLDDLTTWVSSN